MSNEVHRSKNVTIHVIFHFDLQYSMSNEGVPAPRGRSIKWDRLVELWKPLWKMKTRCIVSNVRTQSANIIAI